MKNAFLTLILVVLMILTLLNVAITGAKVSDLHEAMFPSTTEEFTIDPNITTAETADEVFGTDSTVVTE